MTHFKDNVLFVKFYVPGFFSALGKIVHRPKFALRIFGIGSNNLGTFTKCISGLTAHCSFIDWTKS